MTGPTPSPETDIGPYWKAMGLLVVLFVGAFLLLGQHQGRAFTWIDVALVGGLILLLCVIWRPKFLDQWMKDFATWLPFTRYEKPRDGGTP